MTSWRILLLTLALLVALCGAQEGHINIRPPRPESFHTAAEVSDYASKLRAYLSKSGPRFGKRFSDTYYRQEEKPATTRQNWPSIYDFLDNYEIM